MVPGVGILNQEHSRPGNCCNNQALPLHPFFVACSGFCFSCGPAPHPETFPGSWKLPEDLILGNPLVSGLPGRAVGQHVLSFFQELKAAGSPQHFWAVAGQASFPPGNLVQKQRRPRAADKQVRSLGSPTVTPGSGLWYCGTTHLTGWMQALQTRG